MEKKLTMAANIAIIVVAIVAVTVLVRSWKYSGAGNGQGGSPKALIGKQFPVAQSWAANHKTVVLALSVGCHFCTASAPFYQRLMTYAGTHQANVVAFMPQSKEEGSQYLKQLGLNIPVVGQADFQQINVSGTPTLFLVDSEGIVREVWQGQLEENREKKVLSMLG
ncbi:MAG TPA: redoxin family protein [Candidatus Dormibacteraeota bacterium]|nr:redoxin family protein [Candidatus Dormibacteraeota bacterium]